MHPGLIQRKKSLKEDGGSWLRIAVRGAKIEFGDNIIHMRGIEHHQIPPWRSWAIPSAVTPYANASYWYSGTK